MSFNSEYEAALGRELRKYGAEQYQAHPYEIYTDTRGRKRVNIGDHSYALEAPEGATNQNNVAAAYEAGIEGYKNPTLNAWLDAAREVGVPLRFAWSGIDNALGHYSEVKPPWKARARNHNRREETASGAA